MRENLEKEENFTPRLRLRFKETFVPTKASPIQTANKLAAGGKSKAKLVKFAKKT